MKDSILIDLKGVTRDKVLKTSDLRFAQLDAFLLALSDCDSSKFAELISEVQKRTKLVDPLLRIKCTRKDRDSMIFDIDFTERPKLDT
jgi:hypothetical protein